MSVTCHSTPSAASIPSWHISSSSPTQTRRRWGGIFTPNELNQYREVTQQYCRPAYQTAPIDRDLEMNTPDSDAIFANVNTKREEISRRPSLARSNAVCHRRSRAVSRFSVDSADSITEPIDIRWSQGSSLQDVGLSTAATTPFEGRSPCSSDGQNFTLADIRGSGYLREPVPDAGVPCHPFPRGFPDSVMSPTNAATTSLKSVPTVNHSQPLQPDEGKSLEDRLREAEQRADRLEKQNGMLMARILNGPTGTGVESSHNVGELIEKWIHNIQDTTTSPSTKAIAAEERENLLRRIDALEKTLRQKTETIETFMTKVNTSIKSEATAKEPQRQVSRNIEQFEKSMTQLKQADEVLSCVGGSFTPRKIVLLKMSQKRFGEPADSDQFTQETSTTSDLDVQINPEQALRFARKLDSSSFMATFDKISIKTCAICKMPKFLNRSMPCYTAAARHSPAIHTLNEFHPAFGTTSCCSKPVCTTCLPSAIISAITRDWWHNLGDSYWVRCPISSCPATLSLEYNVDLTSLLGQLGDAELLTHVRRFEIAKDLRRALQGLMMQPTPEELNRAAELHEQLTRKGFMRDIFNLSKQKFRLKLDVLPIDSRDGRKTLRVPIFTSLLNQTWEQHERVERECIICAEAIPDIVDGSPQAEERWTNITATFPGEWTWRVRAFPPPCLLPECSTKHNLDMCRTCLARHLETSLETVGRAGCDTLACPIPNCGHLYTYAELKALASPETFAKYDKFRLLTHLATLPNFRWCLRKGCESGQIYDPPTSGTGWKSSWDDVGASDRIRCDACGFDMCFRHQVPWHDGLTCEAYDSLKAHGDPAFHATKAWIESNTKACPGPRCGVPVEKKGGCFHMTCQACKFEFCWECLADWKKILKNRAITGARRYDRKGHNVGCYFRDDGVPEPTMVVGNDIEEATRHM